MNNPTRRTYRSPARDEQSRLTRQRITESAGTLFVNQGYAATTIADVARRAAVSPQTVYATFGTKSALLKAAYDLLLVGDADQVPLAERPDVRALYAVVDARVFLLGYARLGRSILERVGPLLAQIAAGAAVGDPELAELRRVTDSERLTGTSMVARRVAELGPLRPGLTVDRARDRIWTLNSHEVWSLLTGTLGWSGEEYADWIGEAMVAALLP